MGEPSKIVILEKVVEVIRRDGLVERAKTVGEELHKGLTVIASDYPHQVRLYGCCKKVRLRISGVQRAWTRNVLRLRHARRSAARQASGGGSLERTSYRRLR